MLRPGNARDHLSAEDGARLCRDELCAVDVSVPVRDGDSEGNSGAPAAKLLRLLWIQPRE